ncbi:MAG TPA: FHA domain-containing protein [Bryobacteraceae bacterium]|nr:FHA domain-containing protein [Bryobacteraceae bacterium]
MSLFSNIEKTIERGFRRWTERVFGAAQSDELLLVHRAILEEVEGKVQVVARGRRVFPFGRLAVTLVSADAEKRALYHAAFAEGGRLESDVREALEGAGCEAPRGFAVEVKTAESGDKNFAIEYGVAPAAPVAAERQAAAQETGVETGSGRLVVIKGKAERAEYALEKPRTNIGRIAELTDFDQHMVRRNDVVFEEGGDDANATVSRRHAHIRLDGGDYRLIDDESEFGTRVFRDGRPIEVPAGNRRGEKLRPGDEIYLGRACLRFER